MYINSYITQVLRYSYIQGTVDITQVQGKAENECTTNVHLYIFSYRALIPINAFINKYVMDFDYNPPIKATFA